MVTGELLVGMTQRASRLEEIVVLERHAAVKPNKLCKAHGSRPSPDHLRHDRQAHGSKRLHRRLRKGEPRVSPWFQMRLDSRSMQRRTLWRPCDVTLDLPCLASLLPCFALMAACSHFLAAQRCLSIPFFQPTLSCYGAALKSQRAPQQAIFLWLMMNRHSMDTEVYICSLNITRHGKAST